MNTGREDRHPVVTAIVDKIKSEGIFDALRKECLAEVDTKPAFQNLKLKVENACSKFLSDISWSSSLNKNQIRDQMRKNLEDSGVLQSGVKRLVNQVVTQKIDKAVKPKVAEIVCEYLGMSPDDVLSEQPIMPEDGVDVSQPPPPIGLYPFNPLEPPPPLEAPPPLPGFEETEKPPLPAEDELKEETGTADPDEMEMSDKSPSRSLSQASTKKDMDMDCTVTSDEEEADRDGGDLSKGLAGYMAADDVAVRGVAGADAANDDMSISGSSERSSMAANTPEPSETQDGSNISQLSQGEVSKTKHKETVTRDHRTVERREMKRIRTRNKKYLSDDFTSIFTEKKDLLSEAYNQDVFEEEIVTTDDMVTTQTPTAIDEQTSEPSASDSAVMGAETLASPNPLAGLDDTGTLQAAKLETAAVVGADNSSEQTPALRRSTRLRGSKDGDRPSGADSDDVVSQSDDRVGAGLAVTPWRVESDAKSVRVLRSGRSISIPARPKSASQAMSHEEHDVEKTAASETNCQTPTEPLVSADGVADDSMPDVELPAAASDRPAECDNVKAETVEAAEEDASGEDEADVTMTDAADASATSLPDSDSFLQHGQYNEPPLPELPPLPPGSPPKHMAYWGASSDAGKPADRELADHHSGVEERNIEPEEEVEQVEKEVGQVEKEVGQVRKEVGEMEKEVGEADREAGEIDKEMREESNKAGVDEEAGEIDEAAGEVDEEEAESGEVDENGEEVNAGVSAPAEVVDEEVYSTVDSPGEEMELGSHTPERSNASQELDGDGDEEEELERLAQKKLEILKAIELPESLLHDRSATQEASSEEEEGEITDSSEDEKKRKKSKKKSKKKKNKKESRKRRRRDSSPGTPKRSRYY